MWIIGNLQVRSLHQCLNCLLNPGLSSQPSSLSYNLLHRFLFIVSCDQSATFSSHRCFSVWVGSWAPACGLVCCYFICCFGTYFLFHVVYQHPSVPNLHQCLNWLVDPVHLSQSCSLLFYHLHRDSFFVACGLSATFMSQLCICVYITFEPRSSVPIWFADYFFVGSHLISCFMRSIDIDQGTPASEWTTATFLFLALLRRVYI